MRLSICVITMNRANQLKEALESCLKCDLPKETEFVIIDNASTDNTEEVVNEIFKNRNYSFVYKKNEKNIGAGRGRNMYFEYASGEYVYGMDDDAIIAYEKNPDFFLKAINIFENNSEIVSLGTQIYDELWEKERQETRGREISEGLYNCIMFCGGSHFLRKSFFKTSPYFPNVYGYEELLPSLIGWDEGKINAFCPNLLAIHKPAVNKWNWDDEKNHDILINYVATPFAMKKMMYPKIFHFLLWIALEIRMLKNLKKVKNKRKKAKSHIKRIYDQYYIDRKIKVKTVVKLVEMFGLSAF